MRRVASDGRPVRRALIATALAVLAVGGADAAAAVPPAAEPRLVAWGAVQDAKWWARERSGSVSFAVADGRRIRGVAVDRRYPSASVVKAMLALAVVRSARGRELTSGERALLGPMIRVSDNAAASTVYRRVGGSGLQRLAEVAGMTRFADVGNWADAQLTAADQARLFLQIDRLAPRRHRSYLRRLLASIVGWQRWGIAPVAEERGFTIMFKGGWRTRIAHQVALLERDGRRIALAVLTSGTGDAYGRATQSGIAARVLAKRPARLRGDVPSRGS
jgi:Beta-lactamase enzyme family